MTSTGLVCVACGTELPSDSKFCNKCGTPVGVQHSAAEYKQVTVLFADVVHSMDIAAAVGAERLREIMTELVDRAGLVIQRYGGTVDKFTGDGIMAVFGAPVALEDHAVRACLAALGIQGEIARLAAEVSDHDGVELAVRVGLNSGQVIAGEVGSRSLGYTTIGEQVGIAQRMESVAPPGGVMLSDSTAQLVRDAATLGELTMVNVKGIADPVPARCLISVTARHTRIAPEVSKLVGRDWELSALTAMLDRAVTGRGSVVSVVGPAGIGKSRTVAEAAAIAESRGVQVFSTFCESHTSEVPFYAATRLLRAALGVDEEPDAAEARARVRAQAAGADEADLVLLDDALGIRDPAVDVPDIAADARQRRLMALVNSTALARTTPALYVVEDAHWIDQVSESLITAFLAVVPQTLSLVLITYRPDYRGAFSRTSGAQTIALTPLEDGSMSSLIAELLGTDPSATALASRIAERASGNPLFAAEIVCDLVDRGVLTGARGAYQCAADTADVSVPATLQAAIGARIDRLDVAAKRTLSAAAVIGLRFESGLLAVLGADPVLDELITAELVDQVSFTPHAEYAFRHPLIRAVAYESQLRADRAELHRRLGAAIEAREPAVVDQNAALIAEHYEAAGDLYLAFGWHMRAAAWSANRDVAAAVMSWERARRVADALPPDDSNRLSMRIAPRTLLCANGFRVREGSSIAVFDELRELCMLAGDKASLAIGMGGRLGDTLHARSVFEASRLASELMALLESIGDPTLTIALSFLPLMVKGKVGEVGDLLRWSQMVIDLSEGDPTRGNLIIGSPLAAALTFRGVARCCLALPGWRDDLDRAVATARDTDPMSHATVVSYKYTAVIPNGMLLADDCALHEVNEALLNAERSADNFALTVDRQTTGLVLVHRSSQAERDRGVQMLASAKEMALQGRFSHAEIPLIDLYVAREMARRGDRNGALTLMRHAAAELFEGGHFAYCLAATSILVETLLQQASTHDMSEAEVAVDKLAKIDVSPELAIAEITLLRLRTLLAQAHGDEAAYRDYRDRYRAMARTLEFEGHMKWAEAMP